MYRRKWEWAERVVALVAALGLALLWTDDLFWSGRSAQIQLLRPLTIVVASSIVSAFIAYSVFERRTLDEIRRGVREPSRLAGELGDQELESANVARIAQLLSRTRSPSRQDKDAAQGAVDATRRWLGPQEYWYTFTETIHVTRDSDEYYRLDVERTFTIQNTSRRELRISFGLYDDETSRKMYRRDRDVAWMFLPAPGVDKIPENAFRLDSIKVGNDQVPTSKWHRSAIENEVLYSVTPGGGSLEGRHVSLQFSVLQAAAYGFFSAHVPRLIHRYDVRFDYTAVPEIRHTKVIEFFASSERHDIAPIAEGILSFSTGGWVVPTSGVCFTWAPSESSSQIVAG